MRRSLAPLSSHQNSGVGVGQDHLRAALQRHLQTAHDAAPGDEEGRERVALLALPMTGVGGGLAICINARMQILWDGMEKRCAEPVVAHYLCGWGTGVA